MKKLILIISSLLIPLVGLLAGLKYLFTTGRRRAFYQREAPTPERLIKSRWKVCPPAARYHGVGSTWLLNSEIAHHGPATARCHMGLSQS